MAVTIDILQEELLRVCKNSGRITIEDIFKFEKKARKRDLLTLNAVGYKLTQQEGKITPDILDNIKDVVNEANGRSDVLILGQDVNIDPDYKIENVSDGYHTFKELYEYRMLYNACMCNALKDKILITKSLKHHDGELCFGGGWFVVTMALPTGQVTNHYEEKDWDMFDVTEVELAPEWDGHSPQEAKSRLEEFIKNGCKVDIKAKDEK